MTLGQVGLAAGIVLGWSLLLGFAAVYGSGRRPDQVQAVQSFKPRNYFYYALIVGVVPWVVFAVFAGLEIDLSFLGELRNVL